MNKTIFFFCSLFVSILALNKGWASEVVQALALDDVKFKSQLGDIQVPNLENYDGQSVIDGWKPRDPGLYERKGIAAGEHLYLYHAWILRDDGKGKLHKNPFQCIFLTKNNVKVRFDRHDVDPNHYTFAYIEGMENKGLIKNPYVDRGTGVEKGEKFDANANQIKYGNLQLDLDPGPAPVYFKQVIR